MARQQVIRKATRCAHRIIVASVLLGDEQPSCGQIAEDV
jgi:hypothetical protein